mgnify:CR=1 FL=1
MNTKITIETEAKEINNNYLLVECPLCKKSIHSRKQKLHQHGSSGNHNTYFIIHITDNTIRV